MDENDPISLAYELMNRSVVTYKGEPIGTIAACDPNMAAPNYQEVFVRDFIPSAIVYLLDDKPAIVKNFLKTVLELRGQQKVMVGHKRAPGLMPASFKCVTAANGKEQLVADFGEQAIGRVAPVDSAMWWMILLRAYVVLTDDKAFSDGEDVQEGIRLILDLYLKESFETSPAMLVPDASFMIDRRMGVYGHPLEIQALFYGMLQAAEELLIDNEINRSVKEVVNTRLHSLCSYVRLYYWLDMRSLNEIHRLKTEEFGFDVQNVLNIHPEIIPEWLDGWLTPSAGYFVGNLGPSRMDFRIFSFGNLLSVIFGLATDHQSHKLMNMFDAHWDELIGDMPVKIVYPAAEGERWSGVTGKDPKNVAWSYHNGGNWPCILWAFTASAILAGRSDLAERAISTATSRLVNDHWPEYYDGKKGSLIGRRANVFQTWSATSLIISDRLMKHPETIIQFQKLLFCKIR